MNFVIYSDVSGEHQAKNFIESLILQKIKPENLFYYTINFESTLEYDLLTKIPFQLDLELPSFHFYKALICLDSLKRSDGVFYYFDTDVLLGRRFNDFEPILGLDYPLFPLGTFPYPYMNYYWDNGYVEIYDETHFQKYLNVPERSMPYTYSCFFTYDILSENFFKEVDSWCRFKYFISNETIAEQNLIVQSGQTEMHRKILSIYPFKDETVFNVILWRRQAKNHYGQIFCNTSNDKTVEEVEWDDNLGYKEFELGFEENIHESKIIMFYHGIKTNESAEKILKVLNKNN
jgi:hypothetical protein